MAKFNQTSRKKRNSNKIKQIKGVKSRKELRKEKRKAKKAKKHEFYHQKKIGTREPVPLHEKKFNPVLQSQNVSCAVEKEVKVKSVMEEHQNRKQKEEKRMLKLEKDMQKRRVQQLKEANQDEDRIIKRLEKQLNLNKRKGKNVPKSFASDGLDYLLEVCDKDNMKQVMETEHNLHESGSEFEEDFAVATGKNHKKLKVSDSSNSKNEVEEEFNAEADFSNDNCFQSSDDFSEDNESISDLDNLDNDKANCNDRGSSSKAEFSEKFKMHEDKKIGEEAKTGKKISKSVLNSSVSLEKDNFKTKSRPSSDTGTVSNLLSENEQNSIISKGILKNNKTKIIKTNFKREFNEDEDFVAEIKGKKNSRKTVKFSVDDEEDADEGETKIELWEDIYGRTRDKEGNIIKNDSGKYIPPQLRAKADGLDAKKREQLARLRRQLKGLLNRLAENNMNTIAVQLDALYMSHSRNDMSETLTQLLLECLVSEVLTPERLIMEHTMLITILHANVGSEVGAHFLQVIVKKLHTMYAEGSEVQNKELDNLILVISHLYNFKVFHSLLMYDLLKMLSINFGEKEVELILLVLKSVGFSLRKDDPTALKELILQLQRKAGEAAHLRDNTRVKFMLDILLAIKNNNMTKIPNYDISHSEHLKKILRGFLRKGNYVTELKISLEDLLKADERGRWWVVGSAWTGVLPGETGKNNPELPQNQHSCTTNYSEHLLQLARKQRMNTDNRRNIFCILMTAEDYLDAFEKLLHLGLKNQQDREIIYVILDSCLQENNFNPYYGHLSQKFCDFDRRYKMTLQFTLWDKLKELEKLTSPQMVNFAKFVTHLFVHKGLPLSILKVVHFAEVDKCMVRFLRQTLLGVLLHENEVLSAEVFQRVAMSPKLHMFRQSIWLFIHHFVLRNTAALPSEDLQLLQQRSKLAEKILTLADKRVAF